MPAVLAVHPDRGDIGVRIDRVLLRHLAHIPGVTRNRLQRLIAQGAVHINGRPVSRASARIAPHDRIDVQLPERRPPAVAAPEPLPLDIRYEDDDLIVVNKPAGQVSHPAFRNSSGTLLNALLAHAAGCWKPALVSRLDKATSGLVLVAKSSVVHAAVQQLVHANAIEKDYLTIVAGKPPRRGAIDLALDRDPWDRRRVTVRDRGGVPSVTRFERLRWATLSPRLELSLLRCRLVTGRTHQIRVHLAAKGWPIVGDATYGVPFAGINRQALHAWRLAFPHPRDPSTGSGSSPAESRGDERTNPFRGRSWRDVAEAARVEVVAPLPDDMQSLLALFGAGEGG